MNILIDLETLGIESNSVVLSAVLIPFDETCDYTYESLKASALFIKFDIREQIEKYNRITEKSTIEWWKKQSEAAKIISFYPTKNDITVKEGIQKINDFYDSYCPNGKGIFWTRGLIDIMWVQSLCKSAGIPEPVSLRRCFDVRTAINILKGVERGYCPVPKDKLDVDKLVKHDPVDDAIHDIMMLLYGGT